MSALIIEEALHNAPLNSQPSSLASLRQERDEKSQIHAELAALLDRETRDLEALINAVRATWEQLNEDLLRAIAEATQEAHAADKALRDAMIAQYEATGEKQIDKSLGLSVRINTKLSYEPDQALEWAIDKDTCLSLDKKAFEQIASDAKVRKSLGIDFVTETRTPVAVIGKMKGSERNNDQASQTKPISQRRRDRLNARREQGPHLQHGTQWSDPAYENWEEVDQV